MIDEKEILLDTNYWFIHYYNFNQISNIIFNKLNIPFGINNIENLTEILDIKNDSHVRVLLDPTITDLSEYNIYNNIIDITDNLIKNIKPDYYKYTLLSIPSKYYILTSEENIYTKPLLNYDIDEQFLNLVFNYKKGNIISTTLINPGISEPLNYLMFIYLKYFLEDSLDLYYQLLTDINTNIVEFNNSLEYLYFVCISHDILNHIKENKKINLMKME